MLPEIPEVGLAGGQANAVDAGLLPGANANDLAVPRQADGVRLRVFDGDGRHNQISNSGF